MANVVSRYHGTHDLGGFSRQEAALLTDWYKYTDDGAKLAVVKPSDPNYMTHRKHPTKNLFKYTDAKLAKDRYVSYTSKKYPWIEAAWKYEIVGGPAFDYDTIRVSASQEYRF